MEAKYCLGTKKEKELRGKVSVMNTRKKGGEAFQVGGAT